MRRQEHDQGITEGRKIEQQLSRLQMNFESHRGVASNALAEFVTLIEQVKQDIGVEVTALKERN